jgi:hypothetical protein
MERQSFGFQWPQGPFKDKVFDHDGLKEGMDARHFLPQRKKWSISQHHTT